MLKKLTAIICSIALILGSVAIPQMYAKAANYTGKLTVEGALATSSNSTQFYMEGTDAYPTGYNSGAWPDSTMMPADDDIESGIFVDGIRISDYYSAGENPNSVRLRKFSDSGKDYFIERIPNVKNGSVVTIKGTFYTYGGWMQTDEFDTTPIVFEESSFQWNGSQWVDYVAPSEPQPFTGKLTIVNSLETSNNSTQYYMEGTDAYQTGYNSGAWPDSTMMPADDDIESGIFVDGIRISDYYSAGDNPDSVRLRKVSDSGKDYFIEKIPNVKNGSVVTIKGTFYTYGGWMQTDEFDTTPIVFEESNFQWNGSQWVDYVPVTNYTGKLTIESGNAGDATYTYITSTDGRTTLSWDNQLKALDAESGIFVGETKISAAYLKKVDTSIYYMGGFGTVSEGDIIIIKGLFGVDGENETVTFEESKIQWNGTKWVNYVPVNRYSGTLSLEGAEAAGTAKGIHLKGTDDMPAGGWDIEIHPMDELSGIWLNDVKQTGGYLKKNDFDNCWYFVDGFGVASEGDTVTIKGNFGYDNNVVTLERITLEWAEGSWATPVTVTETEENVTLDIAPDGTATGFYVTTTDSMPAPGWETIIAPMRGSENGVFVNGSATKSNVYLKKIADNKYYVALGDMGITAVDGDTVAIAGKFQYNGYVVDFNSATFYYNGQKWATTYTPPVYVEYEEVTLKKLNAVSSYTTDKNQWMFYVDVDGTLPGEIDATQFPKVLVSVGGTDYEMVAAHSYQDTLWLGISSDILPQLPGKDVKVIVKAGKYLTGEATEGIEITEDFTIYVNDYGMSDKKFLAPYVPVEKDVVLSIDRDSAFGGGEAGIYLNTGDHFKVDKTWSTLIRNVGYDAESGVFYNGKKTDAILKKFEDGKIYVDLLSAGISAQDKDQVVIKGMFYLDDYAVSYKEYTLYYNGKSWNETYFVQVEKYVDITGVSVNQVSQYQPEKNQWVVYLNVEGMLPGEIDKLWFEGLEIIVDGKKLDTLTYHSYKDCLYFAIPGEYLSGDAPNGKEITIKAGKALSANRIDGINWTKDFSIYTFLGRLTEEKPTDNTKWQDIAIKKMPHVMNFNKEAKTWEFFLTPNKKLSVADGTEFYKFPITVNGKKIEVTVIQAGDNIYFNIPEEELSGSTKSGTLKISKGAKAIGNAGRDGIRITEDFTIYLYNGVWSEEQFDKTTTTAMGFQAMQNGTHVTNDGNDYWNIYFWTDTKIPGTSWYQRYEDFTMYYNGKEYQTRLCKADSSNGRLFYFMIDTKQVGAIREGDIITMKPHTITCGGYAIEFTNDFALIYQDGIWSEYVESDVQAPADDKMLWEVARFDSAYIPISENGTVNFTSSDKYNKILSMEAMKDYTVSFTSTKMDDEMGLPPVTIVLRGNQIDEETEISTGTLYGYVVRFTASEQKISDEESVWTGNIGLWKNGYKAGLVDQYRIAYVTDSEKAYYGMNEEFEYEFSIYNVTETCVCITVKVNDEVVLRHYDHASDDPLDPAVNEGTFGVFAESLGGIYDGVCEVDEVLATKTECKAGEAVWVAGSYPYVMSKTEFSLDKEGATVANGVFKASKPGEYTLSCKYDGKDVKPVTITVTEAEVEAEEGNADTSVSWPLVGGGIAGAVVIAVGGTVLALRGRRKKRNAE